MDNNAISHLGFGGASLSSMKSQTAVLKLLNKAYDLGITHFDTAPLYGRGYSELLIGLFAQKKRDKITIATKFGLGNVPTGKIPAILALPLNYYKKKWKGLPTTIAIQPTENQVIPLGHRTISKAYIESSLSRSLQRLRTDYIDYYLLHEAIPSFLDAEAMQYLLQLKQQGIVKAIGVATDSIHIKSLSNIELQNWDVLQYECSNNIADVSLQEKYPQMLHFKHSCLKNITDQSDTAKAGFLLAQNVKSNPLGKVLFSTRRQTVLGSNIESFYQTLK